MSNDTRGGDALTALRSQNELIAEMLDLWEAKTAQLRERDSVPDRWERGSAVKLLLQHLAVRETAKTDIASRLREVGEEALAGRLEAEGPERREAIRRLDRAARGHEAISLNYPQADEAVDELDRIFRSEMAADEHLIPEIERLLGPASQRDLPSVRSVQLRSDTHPNPVPRWYDKVSPLKAVVAFYSHLRSSPTGVTSPNVDRSREHLPGPHT